MNRTTVIAVILIIILGFLYLTRPKEIVISETGKVAGLINKGRSALQGGKFWKDQLHKASEEYNKSLVPRPPSSAELKDMYQKMREDQKALDARMSTLYSDEEKLANALRTKADSIERVAKWNSLDLQGEKEKVMATERIRKIILAIESRLKIDKSQSVIRQ
ncbi:MAG TPA: hypothetical protein VMT63_07310 [Bacteroidales bacterium]|nr:hypothetical protein [Bacteroidales bacterium]